MQTMVASKDDPTNLAEAIDRVADKAGVLDTAKRTELQSAFHMVIKRNEALLSEPWRQVPPFERRAKRRLNGAERRCTHAYERLLEAATEVESADRALEKTFKDLEEEAAAFLALYNKITKVFQLSPLSLPVRVPRRATGPILVRVALGLLELYRPAARLADDGEERRSVGRPHEISSFFKFVVDLLAVVSDAGGDLSYNKNYPEAGPLVDALHLLRPFLPSGLVPPTLPVRPLSRACAWCRARRKRADVGIGQGSHRGARQGAS